MNLRKYIKSAMVFVRHPIRLYSRIKATAVPANAENYPLIWQIDLSGTNLLPHGMFVFAAQGTCSFIRMVQKQQSIQHVLYAETYP